MLPGDTTWFTSSENSDLFYIQEQQQPPPSAQSISLDFGDSPTVGYYKSVKSDNSTQTNDRFDVKTRVAKTIFVIFVLLLVVAMFSFFFFQTSQAKKLEKMIDDEAELLNSKLDNNTNRILTELQNHHQEEHTPPSPPPPGLPQVPNDTLLRMFNAVYEGGNPLQTNVASKWTSHGKDVYNSRSNENSKLTPTIVSNPGTFSRSPTCDFHVNASVSATPAFEDETSVYFPAWDGYLYKYSSVTCLLQWKTNIFNAYYNGNRSLTFNSTRVISRTTPNIWRNYLIIGIQIPADLVFIDKNNGALVKRITLNPHRYAVVTMTGTVSNDRLYVGVSSLEEPAAADPSYPCCSFVGTMHGIDLFAFLSHPDVGVSWTTYMIPPNLVGPGKFSGVALWGGSPAVDERTGMVYVASGNLYEAPEYYQDCVSHEMSVAEQEHRKIQLERACNKPYAFNVYAESIVGFDIWTGGVKTFLRTDIYDAWNVACLLNGPNCPELSGPDADYGMAPMLDYAVKCGVCDVDTDAQYKPHSVLTWETPTTTRGFCFDRDLNRLVSTWACPSLYNDVDSNVVVSSSNGGNAKQPSALTRQVDPRTIPVLYVGQKSGMMYCISAENGVLEEIWINQMCPGGLFGGIHWGAAYDNHRVYAQCTNNHRLDWILPNGTHTMCGGIQAYDKWTGERTWATINPACFDPTGSVDNPTLNSNGRGYTTASSGPVSLGNNVVFVTSGDTIVTPHWPSFTPVPGHGGWVYALKADTGDIIWSYETGSSIYGGFSVGERCAYTGIGYKNLGELGPWNTGTSVLAFCATGV